jgi:hypothetical protein
LQNGWWKTSICKPDGIRFLFFGIIFKQISTVMAETIGLIADVALALSLVVALVFGIAQVKTAARDRRERLTLETLGNFQTREFAELIHFVTINKMPANQKEMDALPGNDRVRYIQFAQQMESLGILVGERLINLDLVDKTLGSLVTTSWEKYKPMILDMRGNDPFLAEYFQWLAERIDERLKKNPRQPFHQTITDAGGQRIK